MRPRSGFLFGQRERYRRFLRGRYESCVCKPEYQYTSSNCSYPRSVSGDSCGGQYTDCVCPAGVDEGPYGCAEYYPSPCSSVCKVAYSDNCHIRESVNVPYYCEKYWDDCPSKCEVAAADNCINRTAVSTPYGCESYYSDCSSKCQTAYGDNCRNRSDNSCPYGCQSYWSDCSSKCQTCYADNCRNKTAVSVPAMLTVRPTIPTALPNVPPGAVTQVIQSQEARATSLRLPTKAPEEIVAEQPVV